MGTGAANLGFVGRKQRSTGRLHSLLTGGRFTMNEILDLVAAQGTKPEGHLTTVFEWYHARMSATVRGSLASAATVFVAFIAALLNDKTDVDPEHAFAGALVFTVLVATALWGTWHLGHFQREYLVSVRLADELREFRPALVAFVADSGGANPDDLRGKT